MPTLTLTHDEYAKYIEFLALRQPLRNDAPNPKSFYKGCFYIDPNGTCVTQERPTTENTYDMNTSLLIPTNFHKWKLDSKTRTTIVGTIEVFADTEDTPTACLFYDGQINTVGVYDYGLHDKVKHRCKEMMKRIKRSPDLDPSSKKSMRLVLLEVYPRLKGNKTNKPHLYPLIDYKNALASMFTDKRQCEKAIDAYKIRNDKNESVRFRKLIEAIEWYPKTLELLGIPADIKAHVASKHHANKEHRAQVTKIKKYVASAFKFFEVAKYENDEQQDVFRVLSEGYGNLVTPEKFTNALNDPAGLLGLSKTDSGASIYRPAKQIEDALNVLWYGFGQFQPWAKQCDGAVVKCIQSMRGGPMRQCKGSAGLPHLEENKQVIGFKEPAQAAPWTLNTTKASKTYVKKEFGKGFFELCTWPNSTHLKRQVEQWDSVIPYNMPTSETTRRLPFDPKTKTFKNFYKLGTKSQTLNVLLPLWNYRAHMKTVATKENFIKFFFHKQTSGIAERWVSGWIARMAVLYKSIQFKASMIRQQNIVEGVVAKKKTAVGRGSIRALRGPLAEQFLDVAAFEMDKDDELF